MHLVFDNTPPQSQVKYYGNQISWAESFSQLQNLRKYINVVYYFGDRLVGVDTGISE